MNKRILSRDVTKSECWWLESDLKAGEEVFIYTGATYGCIASGVAVTKADGETPFFEIPHDAIAI